MNDYSEIIKALLIKQFKHECRFSERQIRMLKWQNIHENHTISTGYGGRVVRISNELYEAVLAIPDKSGRFVFNATQFIPKSKPISLIERGTRAIRGYAEKFCALPRYTLKIERK